MSAIKLRIKIIVKAIFHTLFGKTRLKAWILRAFSRDYELDCAQLNELIAKPLAKDSPKGDFIATLTSFPARIGILKYALHSIFSQDLRAKKVILVLSVDEFMVDSANYAKNAESTLFGGLESSGLERDSSFCESKKKQKLFKKMCEAPLISSASWCKKSESKGAEERSADFLLEAEKRGSPPKSEKAAAFWETHLNVVGGSGNRGVQPFCEKEKGEISGRGSAESGTESRGGLPRRFCESARNDEILDSSLRKCSAQNDNMGAWNDNFDARVAKSSLDSALPTQEANSSIVDEFSHLCEVSDADRTNGSSRKRTLRKCEKSPQDDEFALDSANLESLLPSEILAFKKYGLEILWTAQNLRQYNKIIPILRTFPNENIITLDDDIYYNSRTFSTLYAAHLSNKRVIWAHKARIVPFNSTKIADFFEWKIIRKRHKKSQNLPRFNIFLEGCGGVLYPPNCLYKDAQDCAKFMRLAPKADDIWLWAMALLKGTKIACVKPPLMGDGAAFTNSASNPALWHYNMNGGNDRQMRAVLKEYQQILRILAQEKAQEKADEKMGKKAQAGEKS